MKISPRTTDAAALAAGPSPNDAAAWRDWVAHFADLLQAAPEAAAALSSARPAQAGKRCLVFAPHPDDECIIGALPLRLRQESGWQIVNVAVTLGSLAARRAGRLAELRQACTLLGFELHCLGGEQGLEQVRPDTAERQPALWQAHLAATIALLRDQRPDLVLFPHAADHNPTHQGVHRLLSEALAAVGYSGWAAQTEFWAPQSAPSLMVQTGVADTARLVQALACHVGEVARNPYHLRLPAWMADNVRRGGELMAGAGSAPPAYAFATLYALNRWAEGIPLPAGTPMFCDSASALNL